MDLLHMTALTPYLHNDEARSALPDAPIRPDDVVRFVRTRAAGARMLHRVADAVAPETATARPTLTARKGSRLIQWDESPCRPSPTASA